MEQLLKSIDRALNDKNWYCAVALTLILPDVCAKIGGSSEKSSKRYPDWFNNYLGHKYNGYLSGNDCYALRCSLLHEGSDSVEAQKARDVLDRFVFKSSGAHCIKLSNCFFGDPRIDGKEVLQIAVHHFCKDFIQATEQWLRDISGDPISQKNIKDMLVIHEGNLSMGSLQIN